jgi:hypothetical protein
VLSRGAFGVFSLRLFEREAARFLAKKLLKNASQHRVRQAITYVGEVNKQEARTAIEDWMTASGNWYAAPLFNPRIAARRER